MTPVESQSLLSLAPMEGITDRCFRQLIIDSNPSQSIARTTTEFIRVTQYPIKAARIAEELGEITPLTQTGVQLMGNSLEPIIETAIRAEGVGAAFIDLNFGCPAPRVFQHGAGSSLLAKPALMANLVEACKQNVKIPVSAKIRAGVEEDSNVEIICKTLEEAGADFIVVHGRLKIDPYTKPAKWERISRAVSAVQIPVYGNGDATDIKSISQMINETKCSGVVIGRGALQNPWIFEEWHTKKSNRKTSDFINWLKEYANRMERTKDAQPRWILGRLKQAARAMGAKENIPFNKSLLRTSNFFDHLDYLASKDFC